jgi:alkyl sulfatase BDS1-like metallo-beta-lactamase superfamily hydrolase
MIDGMYQVRGFSLGNMTIVEGRTGLIVVDPLSTVGSAEASLNLNYAHRPKKPVAAGIYAHSHGDHYGGAKRVAIDLTPTVATSPPYDRRSPRDTTTCE